MHITGGRRPAFALLVAGMIAVLPGARAAEAPLDASLDMGLDTGLEARLALFQDKDQRLQDAGWNLARANAQFCRKTQLAIGLQLTDVASFADPDAVRAALELKGDFAIQTVARGSPAHSAGLQPGQAIAKLGIEDPSRWPRGKRLDWERLKRAHDHIDTRLREEGEVRLTLGSGETVALKPVAICATRFELVPNNEQALANGQKVQIGAQIAAFSYPEAELAALIAHELAHNVLGHPEWLDAGQRKPTRIRKTEREADRLMPWLLANAGYDPHAAIRFITRWKPSRSTVFGWMHTHDRWENRARWMTGELAHVKAQMDTAGRADWAVHFRREIGTEKAR